MAGRITTSHWRWLASLVGAGLALLAGVWLISPMPADDGTLAPTPPQARRVVEPPVAVRREGPASHTAPAVGAAASRTPVSRLDFDSAPDLYALATTAVNSGDLMTQLNGWHAAYACMVTPQSRAQYEAIIVGGTGDAATVESKRAAAVVLGKCAGFFNNDYAANIGLRNRLRERIRLHEGVYSAGLSLGGPTDKQIVAAIDRGDWQTFSSAFSEMAPRRWARAGIAPNSDEALTYSMAMQQAMCDLGRDCSPNGLSYAIQCAMHVEMCAGSWEAFNKREISAAQQVQISRLRREIADAYQRKDAAYFGLTP